MGGLLGHWSAWAHRVCEIFSEIKNGEVSAKTLTLAAQITDANGALFDVANGFAGCIAGIHEVLYRQGLMKSTRCLNPDEKLSPGQAEEIDRVCAMYPHLCDDEFVKENIESWKAKIK